MLHLHIFNLKQVTIYVSKPLPDQKSPYIYPLAADFGMFFSTVSSKIVSHDDILHSIPSDELR